MIKKRGGLPSLDTPIENVKGIGTETAKELKALGVDTSEKLSMVHDNCIKYLTYHREFIFQSE